ncbi:germination protein YpeB [Heliophilum fasciatum]|uniref:Spore germination protein n=1 Tax=Heliophilum fasciatum TaxID=35700 RepID=A0A4R2RDY2_9FIRM|nr:germination protein YpeB [Heliophilum fasciatum]MCW2279154.1 spore germination protein [Heliophilum fasciatum]TCP61013.1 spore germination protein [Heliophilum fasciatum]
MSNDLEQHHRSATRGWAVISGFLVLSLLASGAIGYRHYQENRAYQMKAENQYQRAFLDLSNHVENMELDMSKLIVSNSPGQSITRLNEVSRQATQASVELGQLPLASLLLSRTNSFVNQVGDYTGDLAQKKVDLNQPLTDSEVRQLSEVHRQTVFLRDELNKMGNQLSEGTITWIDLERDAQRQEKEGSQPQTAWFSRWVDRVVATVAGQGPETQAPAILSNFQFVESELQKYTPIEYDGKFSEAIKIKPKGLGSGEITQEQALQIAQSFLGPESLQGHTVTVVGEGKAAIPSYGIRVVANDAPDREKITMDISKTGGNVLWMLKDRAPGTPAITKEETPAIAKEFLNRRGLRGFEVTTVEEYQNLAVVTLVPKDGNVTLYPDKIKVRVALDDRDVLGYDASAYLTFHHNRALPAPKLTVAEARVRVSRQLNVIASKLALLGKDNYQEVLCWEFRASKNNEEYLVYINANNGKEERIFRVIDMPNGRFIH